MFYSPRKKPSSEMSCLMWAVATITILMLGLEMWIIPQPRKNVWVALAETLRQDICLSAAATENPLSSCLMGIPFSPTEFPKFLLEI